MDNVAGRFNHVLRAILGVRPDVSTLAVHRELGWMQLKDVIANAKLTLAHSILRMSAHRLPKKILLSRAGELTWIAGAPPTMAHGSLAAKHEKSSYYVRELADIHCALGTLPLLTECLSSASSVTDLAHYEMKKSAVPSAVQSLLQEEFKSSGASVHYFPALQWAMMPDLAIIRNADVNLKSLNVAHFRTQGHMLGSETTKRLQREGRYDGPESCPSCEAPVPDDTTRALWACRSPVMTRIRTKHFEALHQRASQHAPKWVKCWDSAVNDKQRTALIL